MPTEIPSKVLWAARKAWDNAKVEPLPDDADEFDARMLAALRVACRMYAKSLASSEAENYRDDWFDSNTGRDCRRARLAAALNTLGNAALKGFVLNGDDVRRFHALVDRIAPAQPASVANGYVLDVIRENRSRSLDLEWDIKNKWPTWTTDEQILGFLTVVQTIQSSLGALESMLAAAPQPPAKESENA